MLRSQFVACELVNNWPDNAVPQVPPIGQVTTLRPQLEWVWWFPSMLLTLYGRPRPCRASSGRSLTETGTLSLLCTSLTWGTTQTVHYQDDANSFIKFTYNCVCLFSYQGHHSCDWYCCFAKNNLIIFFKCTESEEEVDTITNDFKCLKYTSCFILSYLTWM